MKDFAGMNAGDRVSDRSQCTSKRIQSQPWRHDDNDGNVERGQLLLVLHATIGGQEDIKLPFGTTKQLPVTK